MDEIWKDIEGYEGYQVSNLGRVKSFWKGGKNQYFGKERILKNSKNSKGYLQVELFKDGNGNTRTVHRLVAIAFIPNPENKPHVNHKDENKENNCVWNLEWCDAKYNNNYGTHNEKLSKKVICVETNTVYQSAMEAQRKTGIINTTINKCCKEKRNTAGGYHWKYAD